ncbi:membrane-bound lytic murein transglycosylase E [Photobacterium aphoticum]|uniref:Membrane-bound lytic murein transglycosylase E n=1 Tax=Photobacterium aphoticum TaxID=754436 RepID=A0A090QHB7_9GAMM|nr:membrane-bound lytic murein transglycosylase E [Photobacterium aphoticum]
MKCRHGVLAIAINLLLMGNVQANDPFAELDQAVSEMSADHSEEFNQWYAQHIEEFNQWQMANLEKWDKQKNNALNTWGDTSTDSQDVLVVYDAQQGSRTVIDLEKGEIRISYKLPEKTASTPAKETAAEVAKIDQVIAKNSALLNEMGIDTPKVTAKQVEVKAIAPAQAELEKVKQEIKDQTDRQMSQLDIYVEQDEQPMMTDAQKDALLARQKQIMKQNEAKRLQQMEQNFAQTQVKFQRSSSRMVEYTSSIPKSAVSDRAKNYMPYIYAESDKHELPAPLVLAIMHTESHFNPKAKSHVPAYGLMQIVPTTAGHDVNKLFRGKDKPMKPSELYNPKINIETGTAYLKILEGRYLRGIENEESATYAVIAAYNTGSGNVAKAFGERSVRAAINKINTMTPNQVYHHLMANLPYEETRNYLEKVNKRMQTYQQHETYSMI